MKKRKIAAIATLIASGAMMTGCDDPFGSAVCVYGAPAVEYKTDKDSFDKTSNIPEVVYGPPEFFESVNQSSENSNENQEVHKEKTDL